jgi:hypothetical protein
MRFGVEAPALVVKDIRCICGSMRSNQQNAASRGWRAFQWDHSRGFQGRDGSSRRAQAVLCLVLDDLNNPGVAPVRDAGTAGMSSRVIGREGRWGRGSAGREPHERDREGVELPNSARIRWMEAKRCRCR